MLPGKDVAALMNVKTRRLACSSRNVNGCYCRGSKSGQSAEALLISGTLIFGEFEEVERALAKIGPAMLNGRSSPKRIEGPDGRNLQLHFRSRLSLPLFTGGKVEGKQGAAIHVVLVDGSTGQLVISGPEASVKLDVVVLEVDFNNEDEEGWTQEEFESHVVKEREGKRPLLHGDLQLTLKDGVGTLGDLIFTDNSSWIRTRKFRLGLKVPSGFCEGIRIREAKTEAFTVKDHRGELYKKHYPPALNDEVW
ncbi:calmodulin-binding protein 60 D-like [Humulus lupulus]|uniref:calmodulin-binding protein 60 D-like n=1 Tax=Humulus lupulus TaxID=3486 RepID=UPI002B409596|nr:calmodulin-binding protein 60 D-like [Humulus lupulus]